MSEVKADYFIIPRYQPADESTKVGLEDLLERLFVGALRPTSQAKAVYALSDVFASKLQSATGLLAWPMGEEQFCEALYSRTIAQKVREALLKAGWLELVQKGRRDLCAIYRLKDTVSVESLQFQRYAKNNVVEVRGPAKVDAKGRKRKGRRLPMKKFLPEVQTEIDKMERVNAMMELHPLEDEDGTVFASCFRGFNEGRLDQGGRIYGAWQSKKPRERLAMMIDGSSVCEVDIKGSFLFLGHHLSGHKTELETDPYQAIPFVRNAATDRERKNLRGLAKVIVGAAWYMTTKMSKLPKGKKKDELGRVLSLRDQFEVPKALRSRTLINDVYATFPFLLDKEVRGFDLMYQESEIILAAMLALWDRGIPTYPVHDCLLCRQQDQEEVVAAIQQKMTQQFGQSAVLEVECLEGVRVVSG